MISSYTESFNKLKDDINNEWEKIMSWSGVLGTYEAMNMVLFVKLGVEIHLPPRIFEMRN